MIDIKTDESCIYYFNVNLMQARVTWKEGNSIERLLLSIQ